jgi:hypothetical protein
MSRFFKTFLLWLLMAALPLQGFAAGIGTSCRQIAHHGPLESAAVPAQPHQHDGNAAAVHHHHHHDDGMDSASMHHPMPADKSPEAGHGHYSCSACTACCHGVVAPVSALFLTPGYSDALPAIIAPPPLVTGFIPAGLDRPPKSISA